MPGLPAGVSSAITMRNAICVVIVHTGNTSGDDNDISVLEGRLGSIILGEVAGDFLRLSILSVSYIGPRGSFGRTYGGRRDVGEISSNAGGVDHIVEGQFRDERRGLEEEGQWLKERNRLSVEEREAGVGEILTCPIPPEAPATTAGLLEHV